MDEAPFMLYEFDFTVPFLRYELLFSSDLS